MIKATAYLDDQATTEDVSKKGEAKSKQGQSSRMTSTGLPRGQVTVFPNWCKGCGLCVEFCPAGVLEQGADGRVTVAHPEKCTACRWCELHCPDFAIFVSDVEPEKGTG
jgi:2-oxoglutarate ferredoxin oxidoreductase subunit delta